MQGTSNCEKCGMVFSWRRSRNQVEPKHCSIKCRGHTGFIPGGKVRISTMTKEEKFKRLIKSFEKHVIRNEGCWGWKGPIDRGGYAVMSCRPGIGPTKAHKASWVIHFGEIPKGLHVCHHCDVRDCSNPKHLWIGTHKQNNDDKIKKGRQANSIPPLKKGEENGSSKLRETEVKEIKSLIKNGLTSRKIGEQYGVSKTTILRIKNGKNWSHI